MSCQEYETLLAKFLKGEEVTSLVPLLLQRLPREFQVQAAWQRLLALLAKIEAPAVAPFQLASGAVLPESKGYSDDGAVPDLESGVVLGVLWGVLGALEQKRDLWSASLKVAHWYHHLLDGRGHPFLGFWNPGATFSRSRFLDYLDLLFFIAHTITRQHRFLRPLRSETSPFFAEFRAWLGPKLIPVEGHPFHPFFEEMTVGLLKGGNAAFSLTGVNGGLGALHKDETSIVTFGPHVGELDDLNGFGIERVCPTREAIREIEWEKGPGLLSLSGWVKLFGGASWLHMAIQGIGDQITLKGHFSGETKKFMTYFVQGEAVAVGSQTVGRRALRGLTVKADAVHLVGPQGERLVLKTPFPLPLEVMPLAGKDFFWGADFLVAYPIDSQIDTYFWTIT